MTRGVPRSRSVGSVPTTPPGVATVVSYSSGYLHPWEGHAPLPHSPLNCQTLTNELYSVLDDSSFFAVLETVDFGESAVALGPLYGSRAKFSGCGKGWTEMTVPELIFH